MKSMTRVLASTRAWYAACAIAFFVAQQAPAAAQKPRLLLLLARYEQPHNDLAAMTLAWMAREAGAEFDVYYAADHKEGGLFSQHGSSLVGGQHATRIGRALSSFHTIVVRLDGVSVFDSLVRSGAEKVIDVPADLTKVYARLASELGIKIPTEAVAFDSGNVPLPAMYPDCVYRKALAVPLDLPAEQIAALKQLGVTTVWTVANANASTTAWAGDAGPAIARSWRRRSEFASGGAVS
jgi:hypothetical protein